MIQVVDREIMLSEADRQIGVVGDNGVKTLQFEIPKIQDGVDISGYSAWILVERMESLGSDSYSSATTKSVNGDKIVISWLISNSETRDYGYIYIAIKFATTDESPSVWQTEKTMVKVAKGINGETSSEALDPNVFDQQVSLLQSMIDDYEAPSFDEIIGLQDQLDSKLDADVNGVYTAIGIPNPQPSYDIANAVSNGGFSSVTTGWTAINSELSASNGWLVVTGNGGGSEPQASCSLGSSYIHQNDKIFVSLTFKVPDDNDSIQRATIYLYGGTGSQSKSQDIVNAGSGNTLVHGSEHTYTGVITVDTTVVTGTARLYLSAKYADGSTASGKQGLFDNVFVANLTTIFGSGNEPESENLETAIKLVNNNLVYYSGTKTIKSVYQSNNKVLCGLNNEILWKTITEILQETGEEIVSADSLSIDDNDSQFETDTVEAALKETKTIVDTIYEDSEAINNSFEKTDYYENIQDLIPIPSPGWYSLWTTSTFSGWGAEIGAPQNFNTLTFKIRNRSGNDPITTIRVYLYEVGNDYSTLTLLVPYVQQTGLSITYNENGNTIYFSLGQTIANADSKTLFASFRCNQTIDVWAGNCGTVLYPTNNHAPVYYSAGGSLSSAVALSGSGSTTNQIKPYLSTCTKNSFMSPKEIFVDSLPITAATLEINDTENQFETDTVEAALKETKTAVDAIYEDSEAINNSFEKTEFYDDIQDPISVPSPGWYAPWATSVFSGWGVEIGAVQNFNTLVFKFRNRSGNEPITTIRVYLYEVNADYSLTQIGNYVQITGLSIGYEANGTTYYFPLGQTIANAEEKTLFASFRCNRTIDVWAGDCGTILYPTNGHAPVYYQGNGTLGGIHVALSGSGSTTNTIKPMLYVCTKKYYFSPKEIFTDSLPYQQAETVRVLLPLKYDAVVGDTLQVFYRGVVEAVNPYIYNIEVLYDGSNGKAFPRYFELTPVVGDVGTHSLTINVRDNLDNIVGTATCNVVVTAVGSSPESAINIISIGDSLSASGTWVTEARRRLVGTGGTPAGNSLTNINFIGTVRAGDDSHGWEGYGGWTWNTYQTAPSATTLDMWVYCTHDKTIVDQRSLWKDSGNNIWELETIEETRIKFTRYNGQTATMPTGSGTLTHYLNATHTGNISYTSTAAGGGNPFWNNALSRNDFQNYCTINGYGGIDYAYILLGWNQIAKYRPEAANHAALITSAKSFVDRLHTDYPNAKVKIIGLQMPSLNGGIGTNYGASGNYSNCYGLIRSIGGLNLAYAAWAAESAYSSFVNFIQLSGQFDSENNMPQSAVAVNTRSSTTELRGTNGVHPATAGYYQIADASYRDMVFELS